MSLSMIIYNLEKKDNNGNTILHTAIYKRNWELINSLLKQIVEYNMFHILNIQNNDGDTPLHIAVRRLPLNRLSNQLIEMGADISIENNRGQVIEIAETLGEYFEYVKKDVDLTDLEESETEQSPTSITVYNIIQNVIPQKKNKLIPILSIESINFPSSISIEKANATNSIKSDNNIIEKVNTSSIKSDNSSIEKMNSINFPLSISIDQVNSVPSLTTETDIMTALKNNKIELKEKPELTEILKSSEEKKNNLSEEKKNSPSDQIINSFINNILNKK